MTAYHTFSLPAWATHLVAQPRPWPPHLPRLLQAQRYQPRFVRHCPVTQQTIAWLQLLDWEQLPTHLALRSVGERTIPLAAYIGAYLVKLDQQLPTFAALRRFPPGSSGASLGAWLSPRFRRQNAAGRSIPSQPTSFQQEAQPHSQRGPAKPAGWSSPMATAEARSHFRPDGIHRHQTYPGLGSPEQSQGLHKGRALRQNSPTSRRSGLQARLQTAPQPANAGR